MIKLLGLAIIFLALASRAEAASFDCEKAKTSSEKAICADSDLSKLDEEMAAKYRTALKGLSAQGARSLRQSQSQWHVVAQTCSQSPNINSCLWALYRQRIDDLNLQFQDVGPYRFVRLVKYAFDFGRDDGDSEDTMHLYRTPYPQIDRPVALALGEWNTASDGRSAISGVCDSGVGEASADYKIKQATDRFIIVEFSEGFYCPGTPHGFGYMRTQAYVVKPKLRPLEAGDFFSEGDAWQTFLADYCASTVDEKLSADQIANIRVQMDSTAKWVPKQDGLEVSFSLEPPDSERQYLNTAFVPWTKLKPYLRSDAPIPK